MHSTNLAELANSLPAAWCSTVTGGVGNANIKVLRMDGSAHPPESHVYDEALLVLEGEMRLRISGMPAVFARHELCIIPAGAVHEVLAGSHGCLVIVDPRAATSQN